METSTARAVHDPAAEFYIEAVRKLHDSGIPFLVGGAFAFVAGPGGFGGADVLRVLRDTGPSLEWPRLLMRFGDYWRVLLSHLIMFGFVYPDKRQNIPAWVTDELLRRLSVSRPNLQNDIC